MKRACYSVFCLAVLTTLIANAALAKPIEKTPEVTAPAIAPAQKDFYFARGQIDRFESLLSALSERAQEETDAREISKLKAAIRILDKRLVDTEASLSKAQANPKNAFILEHLRGNVLALQEAGSRAIGRAIDADQSGYDFKVSRTGQ